MHKETIIKELNRLCELGVLEFQPASEWAINLVFANRSDEDAIYPLTVKEIAQAQATDATLERLSRHDKYTTQLVEDTHLLCKDGKMVIPTSLQSRAVSWYHHYLQHPGHTRLEEALHAAMYWKGMQVPSDHMSKTVVYVKSTSDASISMGNSLLS
eukprot:CCRYP_011488-RA/>CCRYP_011488-RA protein AED:0.42 eAED:0.64 QI:0/0/0/1/0/0/2/0/155